jgi:hypothetical protein
MKIEAHFYLLNYDFSQEYADANHNGKESENNRIMDWEDELEITEVSSNYVVTESTSYYLKGEKNNQPFSEEIKNMFLISFETDSGDQLNIGCSNEILSSHNIVSKEGGLVINVFLKSDEPLSNPVPGIYIAAKRFPDSLIDA